MEFRWSQQNKCFEGGTTSFSEVELQNKLQHTGKQRYFKKYLCPSWLRKKRNILEILTVSWNVNKMSYSTHFTPLTKHNWENKEIMEFNFLLTAEIQKNFCTCNLALSNCHLAIIPSLKGQLSKTRQAIIACVN